MDESDLKVIAMQAVKEACGVDDLVEDEDGDWPIDVDGTSVFVGVVDEPVPHVHVFSRIAVNVSTDAWAEINHLNGAMMWAKLILTEDGAVFATARILPEAVNTEVVDKTIDAVAEYARDCGPMLEAVYGVPESVDPGPARRTTPDTVTSLPPDAVFVFGSGPTGGHSGGAARLAFERFGAVRGVKEGLRGDSYAIPTMEGLPSLVGAAARFVTFAELRPDLEFWLTRVGCGHAGFDESEVAALFANVPANVVRPKGW